MDFSDISTKLLAEMRIDSALYFEKLFTDYGNDAEHFDELLCNFHKYTSDKLTNDAFLQFSKRYSHAEKSILYNQLFDLFNHLRLYKDGGVLLLFKRKQAEWGGPQVRITKSDVPPSDVHQLPVKLDIYRGISKSELQSGYYGQSWSTDIVVARRFAFDTYSEKERGVVVKSTVNKSIVIYYNQEDSESEVILEDGSMESAHVVET